MKFRELETGFVIIKFRIMGTVYCRASCQYLCFNSGGDKSESKGGRLREVEGGLVLLSLALVATSGNDRTIYVYYAQDKREKVCELRGHDHVVESLSFLYSPICNQTICISCEWAIVFDCLS